ncbi:MAG: ABC transporter permease [Actinobacteria bacterium]|nr:ABC transporter permease [Actinomycetota bacterium]OJU80777.1 MAG: hypothetical protein BGO11_19425 [Solirubrobacterales bacterium 70-9]
MSRRTFIAFVGRRLLASVGIVLVVSVLIFSLIHLAPGGAEQTIGGRFATPEQLASIRASYGLDDPLPEQYVRYLGQVVQLHLGNSLTRREPVGEAILNGLKVTAPIVLISFLLTSLLGTVLGTVAAYRRGAILDRVIGGFSIAGASVPTFATATILLYVLGVQLGWLPTAGTGEGFVDRAGHLVIPILTLAIFGTASLMKLTRARVLQVLEEDHVTFARARGLSERHVLIRSVLRNAGVQVITVVGVLLLSLVAGSILVEVTLGLDGVGSLLVDALSARDIPTVQGVTLLITVFIVAVNLVVDLLYFAIDPRLRARS